MSGQVSAIRYGSLGMYGSVGWKCPVRSSVPLLSVMRPVTSAVDTAPPAQLIDIVPAIFWIRYGSVGIRRDEVKVMLTSPLPGSGARQMLQVALAVADAGGQPSLHDTPVVNGVPYPLRLYNPTVTGAAAPVVVTTNATRDTSNETTRPAARPRVTAMFPPRFVVPTADEASHPHGGRSRGVVPYVGLAYAHFAVGRFEDAATAASRASQSNPKFSMPYVLHAAALANLGRREEARVVADRLRQVEPALTVATAIRSARFANPDKNAELGDALVLAGLPGQ